MRKLVFLLVFSCFSALGYGREIPLYLLQLDKSIRSDSMSQYFRWHMRKLDSATAFNIFDRWEEEAKRTGNKIAQSTAAFLKGQYYSINLHNDKQAVNNMLKAIELAERSRLDYEWAQFMYQLGIYHSSRDRIGASIECLLRAHERFKIIGYDKVKEAAKCHFNIAYVYYHLHNYREAYKFLKEGRKFPQDDQWIAMQLVNTMGMVHMELRQYDSALTYFNETLQMAGRRNDTVWIGVVSDNIGEVYMKQGRYAEAQPYLEKSLALLQSKKGTHSAIGTWAWVLMLLADVHIMQGDIPAAMDYLRQAGDLLPKGLFWEYWRREYLYQVTAKAHAANGDYRQAYHYLELSRQVNDSISRRDNALRYTYVQQQLESEKHLASINLLKAEKKAEQQKNLFLIIGFAMVSIIGWLVYNKRMLRVKAERKIQEQQAALLESEKLRVEEDLGHARDLLDQYLASLQEKNELIEKIQSELSAKEPNEEIDLSDSQYEYVQQLTEATILTDEEWQKFKALFEKVHRGFFVRLQHKVPDLTEADQRLLALIKLNIPNRQMAGMLGISPASVHTARYRLRKKLALNEGNFLEEHLHI